MAYGIKYQIIFPAQNDDVIRVDIKEDGYVGDIIPLAPISISKKFIPSSDDPFDPIYVSQVTATVDVTDTLDDVLDLTTLDDRKYFVIIYRNYPAYADFYGWVLSDNIQLNFNTGVRELTFQIMDGLGMLDYILFPEPLTTNTNAFETLLYFIRTSLNAIAFPANPVIYSGVSYYASAMDDRGTDPAAEPFAQAYTAFTTFKDRDYKYISCLQILKNICKSFGARLVQARGAWYILAINQMASTDGFWYTEYNADDGSVLSSGRISYSDIIPTTYGTQDAYFQNANQYKILLKGFNNIYGNVNIIYPENSIPNWDLKSFAGNDADNWLEIITGSGVGTVGTIEIINNDSDKYATFRMHRGTRTNAVVKVVTQTFRVATGCAIKYAMTFIGQDLSGARGRLQIEVTDGVNTYYFADSGLWELVSGTPDYFDVPQFNGGNYINDFSLTTPTIPITGDVTFAFFLDTTTVEFVQVGNFRLSIQGEFRSLEVESKINDSLQYTKKVELPYGFWPGQSGDNSGKGVLSDSTGAVLTDWYRYDKPVEQFPGLTELIIQQYINIFRKNNINMNGQIFAPSEFTGANILTFEDTDPAQISVDSKFFINGAVEQNLATNEASGVWLQISDEDIEAETRSIYYYSGTEATLSYNP
jgi:hypothetical protein